MEDFSIKIKQGWKIKKEINHDKDKFLKSGILDSPLGIGQ